MRQARDRQRESIALSGSNPGKSVANIFRHRSSSKRGHELPPMLNDNKVFLTDDTDKAELFSAFFAKHLDTESDPVPFFRSPSVRDFQIVTNGPTELKLTWTSQLLPDPNRELRVMVNDLLNDDCKHPLDKTPAECIIDNLVPNTEYTVEVKNCHLAATDVKQCVQASELKTSYTKPKVKDFQVVNNGPTELKLTWTSQLLPDPNRELRVMVNDDLNADCKHPLDETPVECIIDNLVPNTEYALEIKNCPLAETDATQCGLASESKKSFTSPKAPDTFKIESISNDSIVVSWDTPHQTSEGLSAYAVVWNGNSVQDVSPDDNERKANVVVNHLNATTLYNVTVVAANERTNLSDTCPQVSVVESPPNLRDFQIVNNGPTELQLTWTSHMTPDPTRELRIMVNDVLNPDIIRRLEETPASCAIGDLEPNTEYTIEVKNCPLAATDAKQCLQASESKKTFTNPKDPDKPSGGEIAGIVIAILICLLLIALIILLLCRCHKLTGEDDFISIGSEYSASEV
nr:unnamed protein product [Spirometra erinaceieuropaei]